MTPDDIRQKMPALANLDDDQVVDALHSLYYAHAPREWVAGQLGVKPAVAAPAPVAAPGALRRAGDAGISLLKGAIDIPEAAVGLTDAATGGHIGKFLENADGFTGFRPAEAKAFLDNGYSDAQKAAFQKVNDARGFGDTAMAVASNPSVIVHGALESAPSMLAGGAVSRLALRAAPALPAAAAGAIGEGTVAAGQQVEQTREDTPGGLLTPTQVALTAGSGLIDAALSFGGSKLAHRMGATNVATWLTGKSDAVPGVSALRQVLAGGGEEGLQELLQSAQEQVLQNKAEGKPLDEGLNQAAILGLTTGGLMGAGANAMHRASSPIVPVSAPIAPPAPPIVPPRPGDALRESAPPVAGPMSRTAAVAVEAAAEQVDANPDVHAAPPGPVPMMADVHPDMEPHILDYANRRTAQLAEAEKGTKEVTVPPATPEGEPLIIPAVEPRHLTPDEKLEQEFLGQHGGDAIAVAHHYGIDGSAAGAENMRQMARAATTAATPAEIAAVADPMDVVHGDQVGPGGAPFVHRGAANLALARHEAPADHSVVPVTGGFAIRPNVAPVPLPPAADETPTVTAPDGSQRATFATQAEANQYLKTARKSQGVKGTGVRPVQLPAGHWVLATKQEQLHIATLAQQLTDAQQPAPPEPEWKAFPPESGTLGIPRSEMPQVAAEHRGALVNFLKARGVDAAPAEMVNSPDLKATQAEFSPAKVQKAREFAGGNRSILISSDGHVVDGHHQAIAAEGPISAIRLNAPIRDLLPMVHEFPSTTRDGTSATMPREQAPLFDLSRVGPEAVNRQLAAQGYEPTEADRVQGARRLNRLLAERATMDPEDFDRALDRLARELATASNTKQASRGMSERERGADIVREKILAAMRRGEIDRETGEFAQWLVNHHAQVTEGLGISIRTPSAKGGAGQYNPASRIITLFKGADNDGTAVHEILHHTERMMPAGIQQGIHREWAKRIARAVADAEPGSKRAAALQDILAAVAVPSEANMKDVHDAFAANGPLNYDQDYQLVNPSEFWAVNATEFLQRRYQAQTWMGRARTWINGMVQAVKSILGLQSDNAVLRGIDAVLNGDGSDQSRLMLSERAMRVANGTDPALRGRRQAMRALAGSAAVTMGVRGLSLSTPVNQSQLGNLPDEKPAKPPAAPASSASGVLHDIAQRPLEAVRDTSLFMGYKVGDLMGETPGKVSLWHKTLGTPYHLAQKYPAFKRVFDSIQTFLNDVSYYASDAADFAPKLLPKLEGWRDLKKGPISAADNAALSPAIFSDEDWTRDAQGNAVRLTDDQRQANLRYEQAVSAATARNTARAAQHANATTEQKQAHLLQGNHVTPEVMRMWLGQPVDLHAKMVDTAFQKAITEAMPARPEGVHPGVVFTPEELRQHFKLTDAQIGHYMEFRKATDRALDAMASAEIARMAGADVTPEVKAAMMAAHDATAAAEILKEHLDALKQASPARADVLDATAATADKMAAHVVDLKKHGYAPRSRFGTFALDVTDPRTGNREYFELYETAAEMKRATRQLRESGVFRGMKFEQGTTSQKKYELYAHMTPDTAELFGELLGLSSTGQSAGDAAFQEYLKRAKSNTSAAKRLMHRSGVEGFSQDAGRVLAGFVYSNARATSNSLHSGEIHKSINDIPKGQGQLQDQAIGLWKHVMDPTEGGAKIKALLFAQYLGGSVASALVNATQPFMTTLPYLSQLGGLTDAAKHMGEAVKVAAAGGKSGNAALDAAMDKYADLIQPQEVHQMMAQAQGRATLHAGDGSRAGNAQAKAHNAMSKIGLAWGKVFGVAESFNRRLTFIAAFNQAVAHGVADAGAYAADAVAATQFVMNKGNKPVAARGAVGGVLFTFKQYGISYLEMMQRLATAGAPGSPERAAGRRAALYAIGAMMLMAGADGLPFIEDLDDVIDGALQRLGYNFHSKVAREAFLKNLFGTDLGNFVAKGFTGLPGAPLDVSGRLGMANLIPGTGLLIDKTDHTSDLTELAGPAGDLAKRGFQAVGQLARGDVAGAANSASPKALQNVFKAADMLESGAYRDQSGKKVIDTTFGDALSKFIGFQPKNVSDAQGANFAVQQMVAENRLKQTQVTQAMAQALFDHDGPALERARADMADWNAKNPDTPIKPGNVRQMVKNMAMTKEQRTIKGTPAGLRATVRAELAAQ